MKLEVSQDVVSDLWPLCRSGEASAESRKLVAAFLEADRAFAQVLKDSEDLHAIVPRLTLSPDGERRLLDEARDRARTRLLVIGGSIALVAGTVVVLGILGGALFLLKHHLV